MNHLLGAALPTLLLAVACSSGTPAASPEPESTPSAAATTATPTQSPTPGDTLPSTLEGGWSKDTDPDFGQFVQGEVERFNQEFPNADLEGSAYVKGEDNGLILMIGEQAPDDSNVALSLFKMDKNKKYVSPDVYCGTTERETKPRPGQAGEHLMCLTETRPSVIMAYFPFNPDERAFTVEKLAEFAASLQADL